MNDNMLRRLCISLVNLGLKSQELNKEIKRYNNRKSLYSCFTGRVRFNFAEYNFNMLVEADDPSKITWKNVKYELRDRKNNKVLVTTSD